MFYLEVDHSVSDLAGLSLAEQDALRASAIQTIDELLTLPIETIEERTRLHGYLISQERIEALRGQAELTCRVPMLRRSDAALLYASGIRSVEELAQLRPEAVYDRIVAFQKTDAGARFRRAGRLIDRQQAINWARWGQHARSLYDARTSRSHFSVRRSLTHAADQTARELARQQRRERLRNVTTRARRRRRGRMEMRQNDEPSGRRVDVVLPLASGLLCPAREILTTILSSKHISRSQRWLEPDFDSS